MDPLANWNYGTTQPFPYGDETTYKKAIEFLDGPWTITDFGCGTAWAKRFVKRGRYIGVDGSWSFHCDVKADLRSYKCETEAVLMRHILEHNYDWKVILENALASFQKRMALIMFVPFGEVTKAIAMNKVGGSQIATVPDIQFKRQDLLDVIGTLPYKEETLQTATQYGWEHIFYIERPS